MNSLPKTHQPKYRIKDEHKHGASTCIANNGYHAVNLTNNATTTNTCQLDYPTHG